MEKTEKTGTVFDIKEFAVFDGPGIRTTVFMKGCPLRCRWCHNPEGLSPQPQLMVSTAACVHCGACQAVCRHPDDCVLCGDCIPVCRGGLRRIAGETWTVEKLTQRLMRDKDVYDATGGGVTFSGGEPLLQWDFVSEVIRGLDGISCAVETSAFCPDAVFDEVMRLCGLVMMDWKLSDPELHRAYTGVEQAPIRRHAEQLAAGDTPFILRLPVIPGVNDSYAHFETAAQLVAGSKSLIRVDLLPYQRAAGAKYGMVGKSYDPGFDESIPPQILTEPFEKRGIPYQRF